MRRLAAALIAVALTCAGCGAKSGSNRSSEASPTAAPIAHISVHGAIRLTHDAAVKRCYVGKPGSKLLNGYSATFDGDMVIEGGEVLVPEYNGDGTYHESAATHEGISRVLSWVILNIARGPGFPHGTTLEERPDTRVTITIRDGGRSGSASFENYRTLYGQNGDERGGAVFGTIDWTCAEVTRSLTP
jgi:hypothetical protein